jgi:hypothetical protein
MDIQREAQEGVYFYDFNLHENDQQQEILQGLNQQSKRPNIFTIKLGQSYLKPSLS